MTEQKFIKIQKYQLKLYVYICDRADKEIKSCYPSIKTMGKDLNLSITSVKRTIDELIKYSYIAKENRFCENCGKSSNIYYIL